MGKRGPAKKLNMVRKWWRMHEITVAQLDALLVECQTQLPLLACKLDVPLLISALVAREAKAVEDGLFDANELTEAFKIEDEYEDDEDPQRGAAPQVARATSGDANSPGG